MSQQHEYVMGRGFVPGPWKMHKTNWRGEPTKWDIYISGYETESEDGEGTTSVAVCVVPGNATAGAITANTAQLIAAAPDLKEACIDALQCLLAKDYSPTARLQVVATLNAAIEKAEGHP